MIDIRLWSQRLMNIMAKPPKQPPDKDVLREASRLLARYRTSLPLPVDKDELYFDSFPETMHRTIAEGDARSTASTQDWNLIACLGTANTLHYRVCTRAKKAGMDDVFWVRFDGVVISRTDAGLEVPVKHREAILEWYRSARIADQEIHDARKTISACCGAVNTIAELQLVWPDLARAVHTRVHAPGPGVQDAYKVRQRFSAAVGPIEQRLTSDLLTKCLLLPETAVTAWPGRAGGDLTHA